MYTDKSIDEILSELKARGYDKNIPDTPSKNKRLITFYYDENDMRVNIYSISDGDLMGVLISPD